MTATPLTPTFRRLCRLADSGRESHSDAELLRAFVEDHDQEAFVAIVRRHSGLVLGVCRRALNHLQDAEDASQATFLALARHAVSIRRGASLAAWLYGVAFRVAMKVRKRSRQQCLPEPVADNLAAPSADDWSWREVLGVLDEEVQRLPEPYRHVFVECCLNERSGPEVAHALGLKEGTVSSRLARARRQLRERLALRGVTLSAVLAVVGLASAPRLSAALVRTTARAALRLAAGDGAAGVVPERILSLARGVTPTMLFTRGRLASLLLLFAGLLAAGSWGLLAPASAQPPGAAPRAVKKAEDSKPGDVRIRGRVLDPEGRPVKGAQLFLAPRIDEAQKGRRQLAVSDEAGKFEATIDRAELERATLLVARATGFAPDWIAGRDLTGKKELTLRLVKDDQPIRGRLLDLEGRPLANITVDARWVGKAPGEDAGKWIEGFVGMHKKGYWINEDRLLIGRPAALGAPPKVTTDKDGRFTLSGLGRDRVATLFFRSERTAIMRIQVAARPGPKDGWVRGEHGLYGSPFTFLLPPCKPLIGTVRDKKTGKPVAGVKVAHSNWLAECITDAQGRYRIIGAPKQRSYTMTLGGHKGVPYLAYTRFDIADTPGLEPLKVDFELERGLEISGKVLDRNGKPVRGSVMYFRTRDNPFAANYTTLGGPKLIVERWGDIGADGSFTVLGIPGPGVLVVLAKDSAVYPRIDSRDELWKLGVNGWPSSPAHLAVKIDPREDNPKSQNAGTLTLTPGARRHGTATDAAGKPLTGVRVVGLNDAETPQQLAGSTFTATGLQPKSERALVFLHEGKKLGAVVGVSDAGANTFTVKLQPLGALKGRLLDAEGKPLADLRVVVRLSLDDKRYCNLPQEYNRLSGAFNIIRGAWRDFTGREATTDKEGRFRVEGLIPGEKYDLYGSPGDIDRKGGATHRALRLTVTPGQEKDLGDLKESEKP
jgi:RNA polymerase sigma factor (sigma-70 family)